MKINTKYWQEFLLNDYFDIIPGKYHYPDEYEEGITPYISASNTENGVGQYIDLEPEFPGNCIVTGKIGCTAFYEEEPFCATSDVNIFVPKFDMTYEIGLFITTIINFSENYKWAYGRQCRVGNSKKIIIKLPVTANGNPDREFMENYIKNLHYKPITTKNNSGKYKLTIDNWKEFKIGDLFDCSTTKLSIKDELDIGKIPLISRTAINNGCDGYFDIEKEKLQEAGCITIGAEGIYAFYQPEKFGTGNKVYTLKNNKLNKYNAMFICTILNKEDYKYSYGRARILSKIVDEVIKLPIDKNGEPDREFMENYIKNLPYGDRI